MKKVFASLLVFFSFTVLQSVAYNLKSFSSDTKIISAMELLEQNGEHDVFVNLQKNAVKIKFDYLSMSNIYAANAYDEFGRRVILINSIYKNAPIEQIACLIAHESCHTARKATLEEESLATSKEASCWTKLKKDGVFYPETKLTKRLNQIADLHSASIQDGNNYINEKIANSSFYRAQFNL